MLSGAGASTPTRTGIQGLSRRIWYPAALACLALVARPSPADTSDWDSFSTHDLVAEGIARGYGFDSTAFACFDEVIRREPDHPRGYFLKASGNFWYSLVNPADSASRESFREASQLAIAKAESLLGVDAEHAEALFYLGAAQGNLGRYYGLEGSWLRAFWTGRAGKNHLQDLVEDHPDFIDAYLGLGIYHYYAATLPRVIRVLSTVVRMGGNRALGLAELERAAQEGDLAQTEARFFLGQLFHEQEKDYVSSQVWLDPLVEEYPTNGLFRVYQAGNDYELGDYSRMEESLTAFVAASSPGAPPIVESRAHHLLGRMYSDTGRHALAAEHFRRASAVGDRLPELRDGVYARSLVYEGECLEIGADRSAAEQVYRRIPSGLSDEADRLVKERLRAPMTGVDIAVVRWRGLRRGGRDSEAVAVLERFRDTSGLPSGVDGARLVYRIGETLAALDSVRLAEIEFRNAIELVGTDDRDLVSWAKYSLAECLLRQGRLAEAREALSAARAGASEELLRKVSEAETRASVGGER
jgi:tetratricopeptide (TPR) repeat protein